MPKGSPELTNARKEEIINACEKLYQTRGFKEITIKEIGNATSFTRTSIYNYFQTKEEIFLALLKREYELWITALKQVMEQHDTMTKDEFADMLARTLEERAQLLKIMSMNHYDMETGSRPEHLKSFKVVYGESLRTVMYGLDKYFPDMSVSEKQDFVYTFFPFMFGIYPYTVVTEKQKTAMEDAEVNYVFMTIYEITFHCVRKLLNVNP
ncbi:MAG: TetR/AcrR family transcriptional regulator [Clostridium sp.]|nr:TetR/AcrR family transcriptional regulator [Clostridium sp.]